jgi:hypothetical protein
MALFLMKNKSMFYDNELTYKLINLNLENDHVQLEKAFDIYKKILEPIINIKQYDKIGIQDSSNVELFSNNTYLNSVKINFKLYLDKYKFYQSISRWYWKQNRHEIFEKLLTLFEEYKKVCDKVKVNDKRNNKMYNQLLNDIVIFNNILLEKMLLLKTTYSDDSVNIYLDKIIKILEPVN